VVWASSLGSPRSLELASNGDLLTVDSTSQSIIALWDANNDGKSDSSERAVLANYPGLNHAVRINGDYVYASNSTHVMRWPYQAGDRSNLGAGTIIVKNIPCCHHVTRSLAFNSEGQLYVQVGSGSNVDPDTTHARINRFNMTSIPSGGLDWSQGDAYAVGLRNEVGIRFDSAGHLWGVENGVDNEYRADLGGNIHETNPCEELNYLDGDINGRIFGYPYCWSSYELRGYPAKTQFYQQQFSASVTDAWCQNTNNVIPPALCMSPHTAPMDILFWDQSSWPDIGAGDAFVSLHGSWNRSPPAGYRLDHIEFANGWPVASKTFLGYAGPGAYNQQQWIRPVGLAVAECQGQPCIYLSSDSPGLIVKITYTGH